MLGWKILLQKPSLTLVCVVRYAMREALAITTRQGLQKLWADHRACHVQLWEGLSELGLEPYVQNPDERLVTVNTIKVGFKEELKLCVPCDWAALCNQLCESGLHTTSGGLTLPCNVGLHVSGI